MEAIKEDSGGSPGDTLSEYTYLGSGRIVVEDYQQPDVKLNYDSGTAGTYAGLDRFGRVVDHLWYDYGASADRDRFTYGYDRASNRLYRENTVASGKDEFYTYDDVNRLATFDRGDLNVEQGRHQRHAGQGGRLGPGHDGQLDRLPAEDVRQHGPEPGPDAQSGQRDHRDQRDDGHGLDRSGARQGGEHDDAAQAVESRPRV